MRLGLALVGLLLIQVAGQSPARAESSAPGPDPLVLQTRLKKTIFSIDILDLELRFRGAPWERVRRWRREDRPADVQTDSLVAILVDARHVDASQTFVRSVGLSRFLKGIRSNLKHAREAGFIDREAETRISDGLPRSYAFLAKEGVHKGDRMSYAVRGDTLRIRYVDRHGILKLDEVDVGPERRWALLGSYLAKGSDFRKGLLHSLRPDD